MITIQPLTASLLALALAVLCSACTDDERTERAPRAAGFTQIEMTGYSFHCGEHDEFATGFRAKNASGEFVDGSVCCGIFKGCTVRW